LAIVWPFVAERTARFQRKMGDKKIAEAGWRKQVIGISESGERMDAMRSPRYSSLPFFAALLRVFGYVFLVWAIVAALQVWWAPPANAMNLKQAFFASLSLLLQNLLVGVLTLAASDALLVLMDMEENTRRAADALQGTRTLATPRADRDA
jgi:hypothetical protein